MDYYYNNIPVRLLGRVKQCCGQGDLAKILGKNPGDQIKTVLFTSLTKEPHSLPGAQAQLTELPKKSNQPMDEWISEKIADSNDIRDIYSHIGPSISSCKRKAYIIFLINQDKANKSASERSSAPLGILGPVEKVLWPLTAVVCSTGIPSEPTERD